MNKQRLLENLRKHIEIHKSHALEEIQREEMVPAMWSISSLIDLKAQESLLKRQIEEED